METNLDLFGKILISEVRDRTIRVFDKRINGLMKDEASQQLSKEFQDFNVFQREFVYKIVSQITDLSVHNMLCMFEEHNEVELVLNGEKLTEESDGLSGELYTEDGWIKRYSNQRSE